MAQEQPRGGLAERVYNSVKESLLTGRYRPGAPIVVEELCAELQVSRQPAMDALKRLSAAGFVTIVPQVGCRVRTYRAEEVQDFFHLVCAAESLMAELAAQRARPADVLAMKAISDQIGRIVKTRKSAAEKAGLYRSLNRQLHLEIAQAARSPSLAELVATLGERSDFFIASAERPIFFERLRQAHKEHDMVIAAVEAHDAARAARIMRGHILAIAKRLREPAPALRRRAA